MMHLDSDWLRVNDEQALSGEKLVPTFARHFRSDGGMVTGRILREGNTFKAQVFRNGQFETLDGRGTFDEAIMLLRSHFTNRR